MNNFFSALSDKEMVLATFSLIDAQNKILVYLDFDFRVVAMTITAENLFGNHILRPFGELISKPFSDFLKTCKDKIIDSVFSESVNGVIYDVKIKNVSTGYILNFDHEEKISTSSLDDFESRTIKTALSSLVLLSEQLNDKNDNIAEPILKQALQISRTISHLEQLKENTRYNIIDFKSVNLSTVCLTILDKLNSTNKQNINITADIEKNCIAMIDESKMTQAICNLITNAIKAPNVQNITLKLSSTDTHAKISVIDDGDGMNLNHLERFYNGWQQEQTVETIMEDFSLGTNWGLGLPLARKIASIHKGVLLFSENQPKGCNFSINIPKFGVPCDSLLQTTLKIDGGLDLITMELSVL